MSTHHYVIPFKIADKISRSYTSNVLNSVIYVLVMLCSGMSPFAIAKSETPAYTIGNRETVISTATDAMCTGDNALKLDVEENRLTLCARNVPIGDIVDRVSAAAGVDFDLVQDLDRTISIELYDVTITEAIERIIETADPFTKYAFHHVVDDTKGTRMLMRVETMDRNADGRSHEETRSNASDARTDTNEHPDERPVGRRPATVGHTGVSPAWFQTVNASTADTSKATKQRVSSSGNTDTIAGQSTQTVPNQWIVQLRDSALSAAPTPADTAGVINQDESFSRVLKGLGRTGLVLIETETESSSATIESFLATNDQVEYFEPNIIYTLDNIPNDARFGELWALNNTGQASGTVDADIDAPEAWDITTGRADVVIAVIDTGVDYNHPDLAANMWTNPGEIPDNGIDDDANGFVDDIHGYNFRHDNGNPLDDHGHGTHVAGTIAAVGDNAVGVTGVSWNNNVMALKIFSSGGAMFTADAISALNYATMMRADFGIEIRATSNSWGGDSFTQGLFDAIERSGEAGTLFVAAAGNRNRDNDEIPHYPSSYDIDTIISVAASDRTDELAVFSNVGVESVDLAAPGVDILSTLPDNTYDVRSGTSMATPHVSGVVGLLAAAAPEISALELKNAIMNGVDQLEQLQGTCVTGGRLNARTVLEQSGFIVTTSSPANSDVLDVAPTEFVVSFSAEIDPQTVSPSDLMVNGIGADSINVSGSRTMIFQYDGSPVHEQGVQNVRIEAGAIRSADGLLIREWESEFYYDLHPMQISHTLPQPDAVVHQPPQYLFVQTDEDVDPASIEPSGISIENGAVTNGAAITSRTVRFRLADLPYEGDFRYTISGDAFTDIHGNPVAAFTGSFQVENPFAVTRTITASHLPQDIRDHQTTSSEMSIDDGANVIDVNVQADIDHTFVRDLQATLAQPNGSDIILFNRVGGNGDNFEDTVLDDEAATPITLGAAPFDGTYRPQESLSIADGQSSEGTWTLTVEDHADADVGTLNAWSLILTEDRSPEPHFNVNVDATNDVYTLVVESATIDGQPLEPGDEIAVYDLDGARADETFGQLRVATAPWRENQALHAVIGGFTTPGALPFNPIVFRIWDADRGQELEAVATFPNGISEFRRNGLVTGITLQAGTDVALQSEIDWLIQMITPNAIVPNPRGDRSGLIISYVVPDGDDAWPIRNRSWIYDNALAVIQLTLAGRTDAAIRILDAVQGLVEAENGRLAFWYDTATSLKALLSPSGTIASMAHAFCVFQNETGDNRYQPAIETLAVYLESLLDPELGLIHFSPAAPHATWYSTEHNINAYFFFRRLGEMLDSNVHMETARTIRDGLEQHTWNEQEGRFRQGHNDNVHALDANSLGALFWTSLHEHDRAARVLDYIEATFPITVDCPTADATARGYKPYPHRETLWVEGTLQVALAYERLGDISRRNEIIAEMDRLRVPDGCFLYACPEIVDFEDLESVAATAWYLQNTFENRERFWPTERIDLVASSESDIVALGETFMVTVDARIGMLSAGGGAVYLNFDPDVFQVVGDLVPGSAFSNVVTSGVDNVDGHIDFAVGNLNADPTTGNVELVSIPFTAVDCTATSAVISFNREGGRFSDVTSLGFSVLEHVRHTQVHVNGAPEIEPIDDIIADQGEPVIVTTSFLDCNPNDAHCGSIDFGDGTMHDDCQITSPWEVSHSYASEGVYEVTVTIEDQDGAENIETFTVTVSNVPPICTLSVDSAVDEGGTTHVAVTVTDPGDNLFDVICDFDDGITEVRTGVSSPIQFDHIYRDDGVYHITVSVDDGPDVATCSTDITVVNVAPSVTDCSSNSPVFAGEALTVSGQVLDPGVLDTHEVTVDWCGLAIDIVPVDPVTGFDAQRVIDEPMEQCEVTITPRDNTGNAGDPCVVLVEVIPLPFVTIFGQVARQGRPPAPDSRLINDLTLCLTPANGDTQTARSIAVVTDDTGEFRVDEEAQILPGAHTTCIRDGNTLVNCVDVTLVEGENHVDFDVLRDGDANGDNRVSIQDFSVLRNAFGHCAGEPEFDLRADFNGDGCVTLLDFSLLALNFNDTGGESPCFTDAVEAVQSLQSSANDQGTLEAENPSLSIVVPDEALFAGDIFEIDIELSAGIESVEGVSVPIDFDPTVLAVSEIVAGPDLPAILTHTFDNEDGTIDFAAGALAPLDAPLTVCTVVFTTLSNAPNGSEIRFGDAGTRIPEVITNGDTVPVDLGNATVIIHEDPDNWSFVIDVEGAPISELTIATHIDGLSELDPLDLLLPPSPPDSFSAAYLESSDVHRLSRDVREPGDSVSWTLQVLADDEDPVTLQWFRQTLPPDRFLFIEQVAGNQQVAPILDNRMDMSIGGSIDVAGDATFQITLSSTTVFTLDLSTGWSLISMPLVPESDEVREVFPADVLGVWQWINDGGNAHYDEPERIVPGVGYWVYAESSVSFDIVGVTGNTDNIPLFTGWNIIGVAEAASIPADTEILRPIWAFRSSSYEAAERLEPGLGYWIYSLSDHILDLE